MNKAIGVLEFLLTYFKSYSYRRNKCYSALFNILANLDNSAMATRLENVSFHSSSKEEQCLRMFKLPYNSTLFMCQQSNAQNPSSQTSTVCDVRNSRCTSWIQKRQRNQRSNCQHLLDHRKNKGIPEKTYTSASLTMVKPLTVCMTTNRGKFLEMGIPDHLTCLLRNLYSGQEETVSTGHGTTNWFKIGEGVP